jgi:hypothetical protein
MPVLKKAGHLSNGLPIIYYFCQRNVNIDEYIQSERQWD